MHIFLGWLSTVYGNVHAIRYNSHVQCCVQQVTDVRELNKQVAFQVKCMRNVDESHREVNDDILTPWFSLVTP